MIQVVIAKTPSERQKCIHIRIAVFVEEQQFPLEEEISAYEDECTHFFLSVDDEAVSTARFRPYGEYLKFERVATLKPHRGKGYAATLIQHMFEEAKAHHPGHLPMMHAQTHARPFYEKYGWEAVGEEFMEGGIPHIQMIARF